MARKQIEEYVATGKRKCSVARVRLRPGKGEFVINKRTLENYFGREIHPIVVRQPFTVTGTEQQFDVSVNVFGGGTTGQAEAIRHGIARALLLVNPDLRKALKSLRLLTRDPRVVERKKYGHKKARKGFQFSKR